MLWVSQRLTGLKTKWIKEKNVKMGHPNIYIYIYIQIELGQLNPRILEVARNWVFARKSGLVSNLLTPYG